MTTPATDLGEDQVRALAALDEALEWQRTCQEACVRAETELTEAEIELEWANGKVHNAETLLRRLRAQAAEAFQATKADPNELDIAAERLKMEREAGGETGSFIVERPIDRERETSITGGAIGRNLGWD